VVTSQRVASVPPIEYRSIRQIVNEADFEKYAPYNLHPKP
jgi:hypothetical protein